MKNIPKDYVAVNLRYLRRCFGYTQAHLAQKLNLSRSSYGALESGLRSPRADLLSDRSHVYKISIDTILEENRDTFVKETCILKDTCEEDAGAAELLEICAALSPFALGRLFESAEIMRSEIQE